MACQPAYGDAAEAAFGIVNRIISLGTMILMGFLKRISLHGARICNS